jgi:hypothetical protein
VATGAFVPGSIRETVPSSAFDTQREPAAASACSGTVPTRTVTTTSAVEGSIRETLPRWSVSASAFTTQTLPYAETIPSGQDLMRTRSAMSRTVGSVDSDGVDVTEAGVPASPQPAATRSIVPTPQPIARASRGCIGQR